MTSEPTLADELRNVSMSWIWAGTFVVVAIIGLGLTPWEALDSLIASQGVGETEARLLGFVAGYTLPLTVGFCALTFAALTGMARGHSAPTLLLAAAAVLWVSGEAARFFGLGLLPSYGSYAGTGPWYARVLAVVIQAYLNSYGWPLMICALMLGAAIAVQLERHLNTSR